MWTKSITKIDDNKRVQKIQIHENGKILKTKDFLLKLSNNHKFRSFYNQILFNSELNTFFWENPPINLQSLSDDYEFVLVESQILNQIRADYSPFTEHFNTQELVVTFQNLGKDAELIVPLPIDGETEYPHLATFVRNAPENQIQKFWELISNVCFENLSEKNKWLSTAGLGVSWLHVRFDSRPKYYKFKPYKS